MSARKSFGWAAAIGMAAVAVGCSTEGPPAGGAHQPIAPDSSEYVARGTEPFWSLDVVHGGIEFREPGDPTGTRGTYLPGISDGDSIVFRTSLEDVAGTSVELVMHPGPCSDGMSDRSYAYAATLRIGGRVLHGCADRTPSGPGHAPLPEAPDLGDWEIVAHVQTAGGALSDSAAAQRHGSVIHYGLDRAASGADTCLDPDYRSESVRADSLLGREFHVAPAALGVDPGAALTLVRVHCAGSPWAAPGGTLVRLPDGRRFVAWEGTFFELRRWNPGPEKVGFP